MWFTFFITGTTLTNTNESTRLAIPVPSPALVMILAVSSDTPRDFKAKKKTRLLNS